MIRFVDTNEKPINLDYRGTIWAVDESGILIGSCPENPGEWSDWGIFNSCGEDRDVILKRALASAWCASALAFRIYLEYSKESGS